LSRDPKGAAGRDKAQLIGLSPAALALLGEAMRQGGEKYGTYNWAEEPMRASTYYSAALRHLFAWWTGEDNDHESGLPHVVHVMACMMILTEQSLSTRLIDDRPAVLCDLDVTVPVIAWARRPKP
jgi:hypothetical protein